MPIIVSQLHLNDSGGRMNRLPRIWFHLISGFAHDVQNIPGLAYYQKRPLIIAEPGDLVVFLVPDGQDNVLDFAPELDYLRRMHRLGPNSNDIHFLKGDARDNWNTILTRNTTELEAIRALVSQRGFAGCDNYTGMAEIVTRFADYCGLRLISSSSNAFEFESKTRFASIIREAGSHLMIPPTEVVYQSKDIEKALDRILHGSPRRIAVASVNLGTSTKGKAFVQTKEDVARFLVQCEDAQGKIPSDGLVLTQWIHHPTDGATYSVLWYLDTMGCDFIGSTRQEFEHYFWDFDRGMNFGVPIRNDYRGYETPYRNYSTIHALLKESTKEVAHVLYRRGYRGFMGLDLVLIPRFQNRYFVWFIEINARVTATRYGLELADQLDMKHVYQRRYTVPLRYTWEEVEEAAETTEGFLFDGDHGSILFNYRSPTDQEQGSITVITFTRHAEETRLLEHTRHAFANRLSHRPKGGALVLVSR